MRALLPLLPKPSRYSGIEEGACRKNPQDVRLHMALAFPDTYEVGMSYLGQKILYHIVNAEPGWWAERVMAPEREAGEILRAHKAVLCTLESDTPLAQLDCLAFSITHELCYTNVLYMLELAGIPLRTAQRPQNLKDCPLIVAGGGATLSAEPLAPFVDLMVLGDGEESLPAVLRLLEKAKAQGWTRSEFLLEARLIAGVYVPSLFSADAEGRLTALVPDYTRPVRSVVTDLNRATYPTRQVLPIGAVHNRLSLEIARGCTRGCRFCHAGMVYRPVRERSLDSINSLLKDCLRETGFDEISFLSLSTGDFSALKTLSLDVLERCARDQVGLSLPSLRVGSIDDEIIERMADLRRTGITLAPEAGSQRLRDVINKGISEEDLLLHAQKLLEHGWRQVKLYFMIGLPTENDQDLVDIAELCRKVRDAAGRGGPRLQVTAALSPFVPKPFTPFQWDAQISREEIQRRVYLVRDRFKGQKFLKMRWHEPAMSHLEGILSRADRRMADVVEKAYNKGAVFCSWMESFDLAPWLEALEECGLSPAECIRAREPEDALPWDHLEAGITKDFLLCERERALLGKITEDCRYGVCRQCGACDTKAGASLLRPAAKADAATAKPEDVQAGADADTVRHRLIFAQRDQNAHAPHRDEEGRLVCRPQSSRPPQIEASLTVKAAQYRIWHSKTGGSAFLSQLELQALLDRALRRAALPLAFSQGFHPLPLLSFGRALPVGVQSRAEWFALTLHQALPPNEVAARLSAVFPLGMDVLRVETVEKSRRTEQAGREGFNLCLEDAAGNAAAARCFADFWAQESRPLVLDGKKGPRTLDCRPLLHAWRSNEADGGPDNMPGTVTFEADWDTQYLSPLTLCLCILSPLHEGHEDKGLRARISLMKSAQIFSGDRRYP